MLLFKKCLFYLFALVAIMGLVACPDDAMDPVTEEALSINYDNLVGTWSATLEGGSTATIVINSSTNEGNSVTFVLSTNLTVAFTNRVANNLLSQSNGARVELEGTAGAALAGTIVGVGYDGWTNITQGDTNAATRLTNITSSSFMVYPVIPTYISNINGRITMGAYTSPSLFAHGVNATAGRATSAGIVTGFLAQPDVIKNAAIATFSKQ